MKRSLLRTFLALSLLLTTLLASCGGASDTPAPVGGDVVTTAAENAETTTAEETRVPLDLPDEDYDGYEFRVLAMYSTTMGGWDQPAAHYFSDFGYNEERAGEPINDAVHARNMAVEEKYGVTITLTEVDSVKTAAQKFIAAGDDSYDVITPIIVDSFALGQQGYLVDVYGLPYVDLDAEWWSQNIQRDLAMGGKLYVMTGDISMEEEEYNAALYYNIKMTENYDLESPYTLVRGHQWTLDKVHEMCSAVTHDLNGDGILDYNDCFGYGNDASGAEFFWLASGQASAKLNADGEPEITADTEKSIAVLDKVAEFYLDGNAVIWASDIVSSGIANGWLYLNDMLTENRLLIRLGNIYNCKQYRDMEWDFGVVPFPLYDEAQDDYYQAMSPHSGTAVAVPSTNTDLNRTGILLEALAYNSDVVNDAYYETTLTSKYMRDEDSIAMLDIIFGNACYDLGKCFGWGGYSTLITDTVKKGNTSFASVLEGVRAKAEAAMNESYTNYMG